MRPGTGSSRADSQCRSVRTLDQDVNDPTTDPLLAVRFAVWRRGAVGSGTALLARELSLEAVVKLLALAVGRTPQGGLLPSGRVDETRASHGHSESPSSMYNPRLSRAVESRPHVKLAMPRSCLSLHR